MSILNTSSGGNERLDQDGATFPISRAPQTGSSLTPLIASVLEFQNALHKVPAKLTGPEVESWQLQNPRRDIDDIRGHGARIGLSADQCDRFILQHRTGNLSVYAEFAALNQWLRSTMNLSSADLAAYTVQQLDPEDSGLINRLAEINPVIAGHTALILGQLRDLSSPVLRGAEQAELIPALIENLSTLIDAAKVFAGIDLFAARLRSATANVAEGREFVAAWRRDVMRPVVEAVSICVTHTCSIVHWGDPNPGPIWYWPTFPLSIETKRHSQDRWEALARRAPAQLWDFLDPGLSIDDRRRAFHSRPREHIPSVIGARDPERFIEWFSNFMSTVNTAIERVAGTPQLLRERGVVIDYGGALAFVLRPTANERGQARFGIEVKTRPHGSNDEPSVFSLRVDQERDGTLSIDFGNTDSEFMIDHSLRVTAPLASPEFFERHAKLAHYFANGGTIASAEHRQLYTALHEIQGQANFLQPESSEYPAQIAHFAAMLACTGDLLGARMGSTVSHHQRESLSELSLGTDPLDRGPAFSKLVRRLRLELQYPSRFVSNR